jgi:hypothetical protein
MRPRIVMRLQTNLAGLLLLLLASGATLSAQDKPGSPAPKPEAAPQPSTPAPQNPSAPEANPEASQAENPKRILGIIPNFQTTNDLPGNQRPLRPKEKYTLAWHQMFDISAHAGNAFQAILQQASNGEPHYGQGWGAYGQRFGAAEADQVTSSLLIFGVLPHLFKDDPRYFRKGRGSLWSRIGYAASRTVITRADSGHSTFNAPQVFGQLGQAGIANLYYPKGDRDAKGTFEDWSINLAYTSAYNVLKEFYPDTLGRVMHHYSHGTPKNPPPPAPASNP